MGNWGSEPLGPARRLRGTGASELHTQLVGEATGAVRHQFLEITGGALLGALPAHCWAYKYWTGEGAPCKEWRVFVGMGTMRAERDTDCGCSRKCHLSCHLKDMKAMSTCDKHARACGGRARRRQRRQQEQSPRGRGQHVGMASVAAISEAGKMAGTAWGLQGHILQSPELRLDGEDNGKPSESCKQESQDLVTV